MIKTDDGFCCSFNTINIEETFVKEEAVTGTDDDDYYYYYYDSTTDHYESTTGNLQQKQTTTTTEATQTGNGENTKLWFAKYNIVDT